MENSLFHKNTPGPKKDSPYDLIESEIKHLKKGTSVRHGAKGGPSMPSWLVILGCCGLAWLYFLDPICHAWYKGEAARTYLYLHNYGSGPLVDQLVATRILDPDEIHTLDRRSGSFQDYYRSLEAATEEAQTIIAYMNNVRALHDGKYQTLDPLGRMRYLLFIRIGLFLPTSWSFLDPTIS